MGLLETMGPLELDGASSGQMGPLEQVGALDQEQWNSFGGHVALLD